MSSFNLWNKVSHYFVESPATIHDPISQQSKSKIIIKKQKHADLVFTAGLLPLDLLGILLSVYFANYLRVSLAILPLGETRYAHLSTNFLWWYFPLLVIIFASQGLYILFKTKARFFQIYHIFLATAVAAMILFVVVLMGRTTYASVHYQNLYNWASNASLLSILYLWASSAIVITMMRWLYRELINTLHALDIGIKTVLIIGDNQTEVTLKNAISNDIDLGYKLVGVVSTNNGADESRMILGGLNDLEDILQTTRPDKIIVADIELRTNTIIEIISLANEYHSEFTFAPNLFEVLSSNVSVNSIGGIPLLDLRRTPLDGWGKIIKRVIDLVFSTLLVVLFSPVMFAACIIVKLQDGGPIIIAMERVSRGQIFRMYKFRSMYVGAHAKHQELKKELNERDDGPLMKIKNDPRITPFGRFIRKTRIDELPQFFNVIKGDMSIIGPRPHLPNEVEQYQKHHRKVLAIKPGITGPAQISGSSDLSFEDEVRIDTDYIEKWSLWRDLEIMIKTPIVIIFKDKSGC